MEWLLKIGNMRKIILSSSDFTALKPTVSHFKYLENARTVRQVRLDVSDIPKRRSHLQNTEAWAGPKRTLIAHKQTLETGNRNVYPHQMKK